MAVAQDSTHWQRDMVLGNSQNNSNRQQQSAIENQADRIDDQGRACMDRDDYEAALAYFQQAYNLSQLERDAKVYRSDIAWAKGSIASRDGYRAAKAGNLTEALRLFEAAASYQPKWKGYRQEIKWAKGLIENQQGEQSYQQGNLAAALAHFKRAQAVSPADVYRTKISQVQKEIADETQRMKQERRVASDIQSSVQAYANQLQKISTKDNSSSLDFVAAETEPPPEPAPKSTPPKPVVAPIPPAPVVASTPPVTPPRPVVDDGFTDETVGRGTMGDNVVNVKVTPVEPVTPGTDTKAGDQLVAGAKMAQNGDDPAPIYNGGAKAAGSLPVIAPADRAQWSAKVRNDPRMVEALSNLDTLSARRTKLTDEVAQAKTAMQHATDPKSMADLNKDLEHKNTELQGTLLAITEAEAKVAKVHRTIDAEEAPETAVPESKTATSTPSGSAGPSEAPAAAEK